MPRRGINMKKVLITLDEDCLALLEKYRSWGTNGSAHVRRCIKAYEGRRLAAPKPVEEETVVYD